MSTDDPKVMRKDGLSYTLAFTQLSKSPARFDAHATVLKINGQHVGFFAPTAELLDAALEFIGPEVTGSYTPAKFMHINVTAPLKKEPK